MTHGTRMQASTYALSPPPPPSSPCARARPHPSQHYDKTIAAVGSLLGKNLPTSTQTCAFNIFNCRSSRPVLHSSFCSGVSTIPSRSTGGPVHPYLYKETSYNMRLGVEEKFDVSERSKGTLSIIPHHTISEHNNSDEPDMR